MSARLLSLKILFSALVFILWPDFGASEPLSRITQANQYYNQNRFQEAVELYEQALSEDWDNGHLYFNLGNAYFRMGDMARAILNYVKARERLPRDEDVEANLNYTKRQTEDQTEASPSSSLESVLLWPGVLNLKEQVMALLWIHLAFWLAVAVRLRYKNQTTQTARNFLLAFLVLALISTGFRWQNQTSRAAGVILPKQIDVHSGWNNTTAALFQLHQGTIVSVVEEKGQWLKLELPDGKTGWAPETDIAR